MKQFAVLVALMGACPGASADVFAVFREQDGSTNWQYVANTSASLLILILLVVLVFLIRAHLRAKRSNQALTEIKETLEERVEQRTEVLQQTAEQLRQREAYIASIVNSMPVMLIGLNEQLEVTQWNRTAEDITGRPFDDVKGMNLWKAYPAITLSEEQVRDVLVSGETGHLKHTQQGQYSFDITLYRLRDHDDTGVVILVSDITRQVNAENKVAERDKLSALGELASAMAYDISLPVNSIFQHVSSARERIEASELDEVKEYLLPEVDVVGRNARQAGAIVDNLLNLARSHHDTKQRADVPALMDRSIALASELFIDAEGLAFGDIAIDRQYAASLPQIHCLPDELVQVFTRLLRSAFYALKDREAATGEPRIGIGIERYVESLWIRLEHNGACLSASEQVEIFEPYFLSSEQDGRYPVEHRLSYPHFIITEHHGGHLAVTSDEQLGTCFNIQLPL
ncbi:MAG: PAS domain S-box protein [Pseudohongiellaceae bacterium]